MEDWGAECLNPVPVEIALKVAAMIRRGERFAAYVVTPMWPEGLRVSEVVQAILLWTVKMLYGIVMEAINDVGLHGQVHPCDHLNFFYLGNREAVLPVSIHLRRCRRRTRCAPSS